MRYWSPCGFYELNPFPGCNQIVVSNHAFINPEDRGQGFGRKQHQSRLEEIASLGYDVAVCTVNESNTREIDMLKRNGWLWAFSFKNRETNNQVQFWYKRMRE